MMIGTRGVFQANQEVLNCIYAAVDEVNLERGDDDPPIVKDSATPIHGEGSALDSLALVNLIAIVEEKIEQAFGTPILLADERALDRDPSPFSSIAALADYVELLLEGGG